MRSKKKIIIKSVICLGMAALAYFAWLFPFYEFTSNDFGTGIEKLMSAEYLYTLTPLFIIIALAATGIILVIFIRKFLAKTDKNRLRAAQVRMGRLKGDSPKQKKSLFMIIRWAAMIIFTFMMIWGGLIFGLKMSSMSIPVLSCPWNTEQMTESSCYYLSHLNELFELPIQNIILFFGSTIFFGVSRKSRTY
ncbi:hypothetical protein [Methanobrevibacter sp.]|uniref:hypothetical protein n=1 Tax=Methanobrevibacter sp. TaxID=66852 RepID=UPI00386EB907